jgi:hypothetical protein
VGGEAPVTPVSTFDSSYLTFPTNRAITDLSLLTAIVSISALDRLVNSRAVKMHQPDANLMKTVMVLLGYLIPQHKIFVNEISAPLRGLIM